MYLFFHISFQALLISVLYHLSDLLNEGLPLTLQDKLTLNLDAHMPTQTVANVRVSCARVFCVHARFLFPMVKG